MRDGRVEHSSSAQITLKQRFHPSPCPIFRRLGVLGKPQSTRNRKKNNNTMPKLIPNELPTLDLDYKLAIVGEAPGAEEETLGKPFMGASGRLLSAVLAQSSILRSACLVGNICQQRPPNNQIFQFDWLGEEIQSGLAQLKQDIDEVNLNLCLLLGATPLKAAGIKHPISDYRGTVFQCLDTTSPFFARKCLATFHPAYVLRDYSVMPLFAFDIARARKQSLTPEHHAPQRTYELGLSAAEICQRLEAVTSHELVSIDIEGGIEQGVTCVGISTNHRTGFIISLNDYASSEQGRLIQSLSRVLSSSTIPKVLQNSLYDNFVLSWLWKLPIRNVVHDTMLSGWEIYPELPKALGVQTSIWTEEPFYKFERKIDDKSTHYTYCIKDALVTHEISTAHQAVLSNSSKAHYNFNISLLPSLLYMELRGIKYDQNKANERKQEVEISQKELQSQIDQKAQAALNCNSPKQMIEALYGRLGYEPQYQKEKGRKTTKLTVDMEALLTLYRHYNGDQFIMNILKWKSLDGQRKQLEIPTDYDGRMRTSYNLVGTETGRFTSSEAPTGNGTNLQQIIKKPECRAVFVADDGKLWAKFDLSGADGWTVAAHSKRLGDPTMMDDMLFGMKIAKILACMNLHGSSISKLNRHDLKELIQTSQIKDWLYEGCKVAQHGSSYQMGAPTGSARLLERSYKETGEPIYLAPREIKALQELFFVRYAGVQSWQREVESYFNQPGLKQMSCASGHIRTFFGRPGDQATVASALAHEPQANTTYAIKLALSKLWNDPLNRINNVVLLEAWDTLNATLEGRTGGLLIEPLHTVHDELDVQFDESLFEFAKERMHFYFQNQLNIAEQQIQIPFGSAWGRNWGDKQGEI